MEKTFKITGMTCSACAARIERAMKKIDGVEETAVNFAAEKLYITYNEENISEDSIVSAIKKAGYDIDDPDAKPEKTPSHRLFRRFVWATE